MRMRFSLSSIAFRILLFILAAQIILYCVFAYLILDSSNEAIKASEEATFLMLRDTVHWSIEDELSSARLSIVSMVEDERAQDLFSKKDRVGLTTYLGPLYEKLRDRVVRFHFHLPDGTSFLRMHDPTSYGDSIALSRPMISAALSLRATVSGIELGRDGLGLRVDRKSVV